MSVSQLYPVVLNLYGILIWILICSVFTKPFSMCTSVQKQNVFTASDTSTVCECQLLQASVGFCFINFCCKMMKTLEKSLFDRSVVKCEQLIQLWQKLLFCILCCSRSEELEICHGVLWALKHQDCFFMACVWRSLNRKQCPSPYISFTVDEGKAKEQRENIPLPPSWMKDRNFPTVYRLLSPIIT